MSQDSLGLPGVRRRLDVDHVVKRSQGGSDFDLDLLVALCRWCHDQTDAPYERGRLVVTALGAGQFRFDVIKRVAICPRGQNDPALIGTQSVIPFAGLHLNVSDIHDARAD
jgi:HNH endonuclease